MGPIEDTLKEGSIEKELVNEAAVTFSPAQEKKLLRKMDLRIMPILSILYLFAFLDRGNIGNAKIEGLPDDLGLTGSQFNICCQYIDLKLAIVGC